MNDELPNETQIPAQEPHPIDAAYDRGIDFALRSISYLANTVNFEVPITLQVKGLTITGRVISGARYFDGINGVYKRSVESWEDDEAKKQFHRWIDLLFPLEEEPGTDEEVGLKLQMEDVLFIHLEDTFIFTGEHKIPTSKEGVLWRGKLSAVDGFFIGKLEHEKTD